MPSFSLAFIKFHFCCCLGIPSRCSDKGCETNVQKSPLNSPNSFRLSSVSIFSLSFSLPVSLSPSSFHSRTPPSLSVRRCQEIRRVRQTGRGAHTKEGRCVGRGVAAAAHGCNAGNGMKEREDSTNSENMLFPNF